MGQNIIQKILARASGRQKVETGEYLIVSTDRPINHVGDGMGRGAGQVRDVGGKLCNPGALRIVAGHSGAGGTSIAIGTTRVQLRRWAKQMGVPRENIFALGEQGVEHVVSGEQCWPLPGSIYFSIANGHTSSLGALGAFAISLSYESGAYLIRGKTWIQVPPVAKFVLTGSLTPGVSVRDVVEYVLGQVGPMGTPGQVIEWTGPAVDRMVMDERFTLCANALFSSAWTCIVPPDQTTVDYVRSRTRESFEPVVSDPEAEYAQVRHFDVSKIEPQIVPPPERVHVHPISEYEGTKIDRIFIGSCANGRMEDMRVAARILKGRRVHPDVQMNITPASVGVFKQCIREGILDTFIDAGVFVPAPCCGMCAEGANTPLGDGEVCVSTATCNYPGRMGSTKAEIYIGSPATAAASAVAGEIADPRKFL